MPETASSLSTKAELANEAQMLRVLNAFAVDLISIPSVEDLFWYVAQQVVGNLGFVDCVVYQANEAQTELTQVSAWGEKNPYGRNIINPLIIPFGKGITGSVASSRQPIIMDDLVGEENYIADMQPARSEICVPIMSADRILGVIDSEHPRANAFGEAELELLSTVAAMTSAKLNLLAETERSQKRYEELVAAHNRLTDEISIRKSLELKLHEARKLEAIGRLTGRFAHEFNNLLTVVSGNLELLEMELEGDPSQDTVRTARAASGRGADLIQDMLAFAQKRRLSPKVIDLNATVSAFLKDSAPDLSSRIDLSLANDLSMVSADPTAVSGMLMNLVLNAVEAMPDEGRLRIETENVLHLNNTDIFMLSNLVPGRYVRVSVQDHGQGIQPELLSQIFDPFFTTKGPTQGTGLGLSMVLGVMRQSGGSVSVETETGKGSTFALYFPVVERPVNDLLTISR